jgi:hypothetical protein
MPTDTVPAWPVAPDLSSGCCRTRKVLPMTCMVAVFTGVCGTVSAEDPVTAAERQREVVARIDEVQSLEGSTSADLIQPLSNLALLHAEDGDHELAIAVIERARHVVRVNYGLNSLEEAAQLRALIRSEEALGRFAAAWELEQQLLTLAARHPDDLRTMPIFREIGAKRFDLFQHYLGGAFPPQIVLGCYYDDMSFRARASQDPGDRRDGNCRAGSRSAAARGILREALSYYRAAARVMVRNELYASDELRELENESIRFPYEHIESDARLTINTSPAYVAHVDASLLRLLDYEFRSDASELSQLEALIRLADWRLMFARGGIRIDAALDLYDVAYRRLTELGVPRETVDKFFSPSVPVALPSFLPNPLVTQNSAASVGHIDVAFDITRAGSSRRVEILDTSKNPSRAAERDLVSLVRRTRFRPLVTDGGLVEASRVVVRYYLVE